MNLDILNYCLFVNPRNSTKFKILEEKVEKNNHFF